MFAPYTSRLASSQPGILAVYYVESPNGDRATISIWENEQAMEQGGAKANAAPLLSGQRGEDIPSPAGLRAGRSSIRAWQLSRPPSDTAGMIPNDCSEKQSFRGGESLPTRYGLGPPTSPIARHNWSGSPGTSQPSPLSPGTSGSLAFAVSARPCCCSTMRRRPKHRARSSSAVNAATTCGANQRLHWHWLPTAELQSSIRLAPLPSGSDRRRPRVRLSISLVG
jgi:hypothetical protein